MFTDEGGGVRCVLQYTDSSISDWVNRGCTVSLDYTRLALVLRGSRWCGGRYRYLHEALFVLPELGEPVLKLQVAFLDRDHLVFHVMLLQLPPQNIQFKHFPVLVAMTTSHF